MRQHTSAYVSIRQHPLCLECAYAQLQPTKTLVQQAGARDNPLRLVIQQPVAPNARASLGDYQKKKNYC
jgi:hypothetical protein